ncbi:MAG TPA: toll/interleukin-1 receptor domain-containing protein [Candidatus Limnocylindrales bacterium]|nr:toll/interleukin-1 receptor domain-containing protein [Candidatus Limnocylindrales bacterium]
MPQRVRVFISHSARDGDANAIRQAIRARLENDARYSVLMDDVTLDPGDAWRSRINLWLGSCDAAIVIVSKGALSSDYVAFELSVLGYRRWRERREGREFRIIPVFAGVTMNEVSQSRLAPTQAGEWMGIIEGDAVAVADKVVRALEGVSGAASRPIEIPARVLDAHLPGTDFYVSQAAAALGYELPWDVTESKRFCLALRLLGSGMSIPAVRAVRQLRGDPSFQPNHLEIIIGLLSSAWVDLKAREIPALVLSQTPPAIFLNASFPDTARMYMRAASYQGEQVLHYLVAEPNTIIEETDDNPEYRRRIIEAVRQELFRKLEVTTDTALARELADSPELGEAVVVVMSAPSISPSTVAELRDTFKHVAFFLLTGASGDTTRLAGESVYVIRPPLAVSDEEKCREQYEDFCRRMRRPLGEQL